MSSKRYIGVVIPLGPGKKERSRLYDLLDSLCFYERSIGTVCVIEDFLLNDQERNSRQFPFEIEWIRNPRRGRGDGWAGGLCAGILEGLRWFYFHEKTIELVVKLDTDALCIGPFAERLRSRVCADEKYGILGTHRVNPNGERRSFENWIPSIKTHLRLISVRGRYVQVTSWGAAKRRRKALERALKNGYEWGQHCQGGAYAVSGELIRRLGATGMLDRPCDWLRSGLGEDVMLGILSKAVNMELCDFNKTGEVFGVQHIGLSHAPQDLLENGYSIIHSIKDFGQYSEEDLRAYFKLARAGGCPSD